MEAAAFRLSHALADVAMNFHMFYTHVPFITRNKTFIYILDHSIKHWRFHFDE